MAEKEIKRWITVNGTHIPIYDGDEFEQGFLDGLGVDTSLESYLNDGAGVKKSDVSEEDEKKFKNGEWDYTPSSFTDAVPYARNFGIEKAYRDAVGDVPKTPSGAVTDKTRALAKKNIDWYETNAKESRNAAEKYRAKMNDFSSKGGKKLCYIEAKRLEKNAEDVPSNLEWFKRTYSKYL